MTKLNQQKIGWLVRQVVRHRRPPSEVAPVYGLTTRRVQQLVKTFRETGTMPTLNKNRRPRVALTEEQHTAIEAAFARTKLSARLLYYELRRRGTPVPKNKLYEYLKSTCRVIPDKKKQKQRKRCRYERDHSGSLVHSDWHRTSLKHPHCILWLDDASRKILSGHEGGHASGAASIRTFEAARQATQDIHVSIHQVNTDRGSQFHSNKGGKSQFRKHLDSIGIKHVLSRRNNPQTNGKLERHWREYNKHRWTFNNLQEYINWYNDRLHGALRLDWAETPNEAFLRKARPESLVGMMFK